MSATRYQIIYIMLLSLVQKSSKLTMRFNFYRRFQLSNTSAIFSGGFLRIPLVTKTITRNPCTDKADKDKAGNYLLQRVAIATHAQFFYI
jgi:hypothetical protein